MPTTDPRLELILAYADDELILGHRLSEWTGWVPFVEEDLALSSIAQDEIAHARAYLQIAVDLGARAGDANSLDALALGRDKDAYRHAIVCERPNRDFAYTIARQWLYDRADEVRVRGLASSSFKPLRDLAGVLVLEERYHLEHTEAWFARLANGPVDGRHRFGSALASVFPEALAIFEPLPSEPALRADGTLGTSHDEMRAQWFDGVRAALDAAGLQQVMDAPASGIGGRHGTHSEDWPAVWDEMTALYRAHPGASW